MTLWWGSSGGIQAEAFNSRCDGLWLQMGLKNR